MHGICGARESIISALNRKKLRFDIYAKSEWMDPASD